jgi:hypothetical protein
MPANIALGIFSANKLATANRLLPPVFATLAIRVVKSSFLISVILEEEETLLRASAAFVCSATVNSNACAKSDAFDAPYFASNTSIKSYKATANVGACSTPSQP